MPTAESVPVAVAVAVVEHEGRVLIGQRPPGAFLAGFWEFPGGKVSAGETIEEAAVRECREETRVEIRVVRPLAVVDHQFKHERVRLHFLAAEPVATSPAPGGPFRWVCPSELSKYRFPPANQPILEALVSKTTGSTDA